MTSALDLDLDARERDADLFAARRQIGQARLLLRSVVDADPSRTETWLKLAAICRAGGDLEAAHEAISGALKIDPLHFMALLSRARLHEASGEQAAAARGYTRALAQLAPDDPVPPSLAAAVTHARAVASAYARDVSTTWDRAIDAGPLEPVERSRLARFKSNALRETRVFHCEPTHYHYPGLAEREFHDRPDFPWLAELESATPAILDEFEALAAARAARAEPYIRYGQDVPVRQWAGLNNSLDWTAFHLLQGGRRVDENADLCPKTMAVLANIDQPSILGRSPNAMFSLLRPRTRIPPHTGVANTRLVCHLPLIVPEGCWFRVGAETRTWRIGEAFVFDDTIEHEAANDSDLPRVVLIVDTWHPALGPRERDAVVRVMEADEAEHGAPL